MVAPNFIGDRAKIIIRRTAAMMHAAGRICRVWRTTKRGLIRGRTVDCSKTRIQLPTMDGYTATRKIKADPAMRSIPIIAVTSYALSGEEKKARAAGYDDYVPKPFSPRQLLAKIRQHLS